MATKIEGAELPYLWECRKNTVHEDEPTIAGERNSDNSKKELYDEKSPNQVSLLKNTKPTKPKRDLDCEKLGELLLKGWTMLADHCPSSTCSIPLLRNRNGKIFCVSCENWMEKIESGSYRLSTEIQQPSAAQKSNDIETSAMKKNLVKDSADMDDVLEQSHSEDKAANQEKNISSQLAEKMLLGWTLLGINCPNPICLGVPLLRNRDQEMFCTNCQNWVKEETSDDNSECIQANVSTSRKEKVLRTNEPSCGSAIKARSSFSNTQYLERSLQCLYEALEKYSRNLLSSQSVNDNLATLTLVKSTTETISCIEKLLVYRTQ